MSRYRLVDSDENEDLTDLVGKIEAIIKFREGKNLFQKQAKNYGGSNALMRFERLLNATNTIFQSFLLGKRGAPSKEDMIKFKKICHTFSNHLDRGEIEIYDGTKDVLEVYKKLFNDLHGSINEYCLKYNIGIDNGRQH